MERVITINLNGNAYQLDESACTVLQAYLDRAARALAANPDKDEIIRDLEQAIADKARAYLSSAKTVLSKAEVEKIIEEMGPVEIDGDSGPGADAGEKADSARAAFDDDDRERPRKRLYRLRDDAVIAGVCSGMAAYFDLDVWIVRILWIIAALFTGGGALLVYLVLMFVVPSANTSAEWAEARGVPHTAHGVIEEAKRRYAEFERDGGVRSAWRRSRRAFRRWRREHGHFFYGPAPPPMKPAGYFTRFIAGVFAFVFSILGAALTIAFLIALLSLVATGAVLGWVPPFDAPVWLLIVILCIIFAAIAGPVRAIRHASYATVRGYDYRPGDGVWHSLANIAIVLAFVWLAWTYWPDARAWMESLPDSVSALNIEIGN
ncbi:MAG: PspC domain-containing protein [Hydrogenophilaceae bacterium]|jgi:phage shock protein PspC (stress-responsive transcriptional regulator)|nr:PspC domain-containing protein [Hydrogenophilaceae bacterium]